MQIEVQNLFLLSTRFWRSFLATTCSKRASTTSAFRFVGWNELKQINKTRKKVHANWNVGVQIISFRIVSVTHIFGNYVASGESGSFILLQFKAAATKRLSEQIDNEGGEFKWVSTNQTDGRIAIRMGYYCFLKEILSLGIVAFVVRYQTLQIY